VARVIKETVSDVVTNHLSDPRIKGFVSVTEVELSSDLRNADIYLSIFGTDQNGQKNTFDAICHAKNRIQSLVVQNWPGKYCPVLKFAMDEKFKKSLKVLRLIENVARELPENEKQQ